MTTSSTGSLELRSGGKRALRTAGFWVPFVLMGAYLLYGYLLVTILRLVLR